MDIRYKGELMGQKEIEIIIPADGNPPSIESLGFVGTECSKNIKAVLDGLKAKDVSKKRTADWYKKKKVQIRQSI